MPNMSYCRFENTLEDLQDCEQALRDNKLFDLSESELEKAKKLIQLCGDIAEEFYELIEND